MIDYKIVKDPTVWGLQMKVNELVVEGYRPQGALVVDNGEYIQTMTKEIQDSVNEDKNVADDKVVEDVLLNEEEHAAEDNEGEEEIVFN